MCVRLWRVAKLVFWGGGEKDAHAIGGGDGATGRQWMR